MGIVTLPSEEKTGSDFASMIAGVDEGGGD